MKMVESKEKHNETRKLISNHLNEYNSKFINNRFEEVCFYINDDEENLIAGIVGEVYGSGMYIQLLWVDEKKRGLSLGKKLLENAESKAREIGCHFITLDTFNFQAPDYYLRCGFQIFGELDCGESVTRYYLKKVL